MRKLVILGSSPAAVTLIETLKILQPEEFQITLICFDEFLPYDRELFTRVIGKEMALSKTFVHGQDFYEKNQVNVLLQKAISRINLKRKKIFMEERESIDFDDLVITEWPQQRFKDVRGNQKIGIYNWDRFKETDQIMKNLIQIDTVTIESSSFKGFEIAMACLKQGKEVILVSSQPTFLSSYISPEAAQWLTEHLEAKNLRIAINNEIVEFLGDGDLKATRLKSGKVIGTQMALCEEMRYDYKIFSEDSSVQIDRRICVNVHGQTSLDYVYACDQAAVRDTKTMEEDLAAPAMQGQIIGQVLVNQEPRSQNPLKIKEAVLGELSLIMIGNPKGDRIIETAKAGQESLQYIRIILSRDIPVGCILLNSKEFQEPVARFIEEKVSIQLEGPMAFDDVINAIKQKTTTPQTVT